MPAGLPVDFISGAIAMGFLVLGLFFLKFWRRTRDSLFLMFAFAFWLMAASQAAFSLTGGAQNEQIFTAAAQKEQVSIYLLRAAGFLLIIAAMIRKNIGGRRR